MHVVLILPIKMIVAMIAGGLIMIMIITYCIKAVMSISFTKVIKNGLQKADRI